MVNEKHDESSMISFHPTVYSFGWKRVLTAVAVAAAVKAAPPELTLLDTEEVGDTRRARLETQSFVYSLFFCFTFFLFLSFFPNSPPLCTRSTRLSWHEVGGQLNWSC